MGIAFFETIGPEGEQLASQVANELDMAIGFDPEFDSITFDGPGDDSEVEAAVIAALDGFNSEWSEHLRVAS